MRTVYRIRSAPFLRATLVSAVASLALIAGACRTPASSTSSADSDVGRFLDDANATMLRLGNEANQAGWTQETYITPDTQAISARASEAYMNAVTDYAKRAATIDASKATPLQQRELKVLMNSLTMAAPADPKESAELAQLVASMDATYGKGKYCPPGGEGSEKCLDIEQITEILARDRNPARLREVWEGWHTISPPMKKD